MKNTKTISIRLRISEIEEIDKLCRLAKIKRAQFFKEANKRQADMLEKNMFPELPFETETAIFYPIINMNE